MYNKFKNAIRGCFVYIKNDRAYLYHITIQVALVTIMLAIDIHISYFQILIFGFVVIIEWVNTLIERTVDYISIDRNEVARNIKDMSAGVVLFASILIYANPLIIILLKLLKT